MKVGWRSLLRAEGNLRRGREGVVFVIKMRDRCDTCVKSEKNILLEQHENTKNDLNTSALMKVSWRMRRNTSCIEVSTSASTDYLGTHLRHGIPNVRCMSMRKFAPRNRKTSTSGLDHLVLYCVLNN